MSENKNLDTAAFMRRWHGRSETLLHHIKTEQLGWRGKSRMRMIWFVVPGFLDGDAWNSFADDFL